MLADRCGAGHEVVALGARVGRDHTGSHQETEHAAPDAVAEHRLEAGGDDQRGEQEVGDEGRSEPEPGDRRRDGDDGADALGEALRRAGYGTGLDTPASEGRRDHPGDELTERAEPRTGEHAGDETVREGQDEPCLAEEQGRGGDQHHPAGDQPSGHLVHRIGEAEWSRHECDDTRQSWSTFVGRHSAPPESGPHRGDCLTDEVTATSATTISESVRLETEGDVALVIVDNPPVNALSSHVRQGLFDGLNRAVSDGAKAIVVICDGRTFIAGADISEFGGAMKGASLQQVQAAMEDAPIPVIAAIHGTALGGGLEVALCAHYRVAVSSAKFGLPEVNLGLLPGAGGTQRLPRLVGVPMALEMMTSGRHISSTEALDNGLIDEVTASDDIAGLRAAAVAFAERAVAEQLPLKRVRDRDDKVAAAKGDTELFAELPPVGRQARPAASSRPSTTSSASRRRPTCRSTRA